MVIVSCLPIRIYTVRLEMEDRAEKGLIQQNVLQLLRLLDSQREETERGRLRGLVHKI